MTPFYFLTLAMFLMSLAGLTFYRASLLPALLCLEGMMLTLFLSFSVWVIKYNALVFSLSPVILITFSACEASMGLALLIATVRTHGTTHLKSINLLQC